MKRLVIGDVHGCYDELQELLDRAALSDDDPITALGDIVDRGPDSPRVLDFFRHTPNAASVIGNHERKHVRSYRGDLRPALSQVIARGQIGEDAYPDACAFMASLPRSVDLPEALLVHGFFEPGLPLADQRDTVIIGTLTGEHYLQSRYARPWYELYDGDKPIVVGHHSYLGTGEPLIVHDRVFCIDTGCCNGGALTGLVLPDFRIVSVPSRGDHWARMKSDYAHVRFASTPVESMTWDVLEATAGAAARHGAASPRVQARAHELAALLADARQALDTLHRHVLATTARALAELRAERNFDGLSPNKQGRVYAAKIGHGPLASLLHLARKGELTLRGLRHHKAFRRPTALIDFVRQLGAAGCDRE